MLLIKWFSQYFWYFLTGSNILRAVFSDIISLWVSYPHRMRKASQ